MTRLFSFSLMLMMGVASATAQQPGVTQCGTPTGQERFPVQAYRELPNPNKPDPKEWAKAKGTYAHWGSTNQRYAKQVVPQTGHQTSLLLEGWRGEVVNAQAVVWSGVDVSDLTITLTSFQNTKGEQLPSEAFQTGPVRYVMTDELNKDGKGGCGHRPDASKYDSLLVADPIDLGRTVVALEAQTTQPVWVQCAIPPSAQPGTYRGALLLKAGDQLIKRLPLAVRVSTRVLPKPETWAYHLDLWQNPFAVARYHQVPLWSDAHFEAMRPLMKRLADAGQKVITASIMHKPWNAQTEDHYESMITWMKRADGTWVYDYTVFDRWVEFMSSLGIKKQINCYSMVPWELSFRYYDQATDGMKSIKAAPGDAAYEELWVPMLKAFASHLREKGWFDRCAIAMDERPMEVMKKTLAVIRRADPAFKVSLAGNYHAEIEPDIDDYCITIAQDFPIDVRARRAAEGKPTTYYTCCTEVFPNTFTFSEPAEATWISYYCAKKQLDGYLRWAYNSWPLEPLLDSRFRSWAGGDTYLVYPGARTSIRFEKLIEGIQAHEKITCLRKEFKQTGNKAGLRKIDRLLSSFGLYDAPQIPAARTVERANKLLNSF